MTTLYACALTAVIVYSAGWCHGHATSRVRHVRIPTGCRCTDHAAIDKAEELFIARFRAELDDADSPFGWSDPDHDDHPGSSAA